MLPFVAFEAERDDCGGLIWSVNYQRGFYMKFVHLLQWYFKNTDSLVVIVLGSFLKKKRFFGTKIWFWFLAINVFWVNVETFHRVISEY